MELSREAAVRLAWMDSYRRQGNVARTCRHFGISRETFYRWQRRYDPLDLRQSGVIVPIIAVSGHGLRSNPAQRKL